MLLMVGSAGYAVEAFGYILVADFGTLPGAGLRCRLAGRDRHLPLAVHHWRARAGAQCGRL
jgi:hypothetical protein